VKTAGTKRLLCIDTAVPMDAASNLKIFSLSATKLAYPLVALYNFTQSKLCMENGGAS